MSRRLGHPRAVVFDETHVGKFIVYLLRGTYFFDVHPPLAKLIYAGTGRALAQSDTFMFDQIGTEYVTVLYFSQRVVTSRHVTSHHSQRPGFGRLTPVPRPSERATADRSSPTPLGT